MARFLLVVDDELYIALKWICVVRFREVDFLFVLIFARLIACIYDTGGYSPDECLCGWTSQRRCGSAGVPYRRTGFCQE